MLTLAFDTATSTATVALVRGGEVLAEQATDSRELLADADAVLRGAGVEPGELEGLAVGIGPGSFTGIRIGLAAARGLALALGVRVAGGSTLDALAAGAPGAVPVIDAKRRELFLPGPAVVPWDRFEIEAGRTYVGDGAIRYREHIESHGGVVPAEDAWLHVPRASFHALSARDYVDAELVEPLYVRVPDAEAAA